MPSQIQVAVLNYPTHHQAMVCGAIGLVLIIMGSLCLLARNKVGHCLFLLGIFFILSHDFLYGPQVRFASLQIFEDPGYVLLGMIIALIYSEPVKSLYKNKGINLATILSLRIICVLSIKQYIYINKQLITAMFMLYII